jgi:hypothetical protein
MSDEAIKRRLELSSAIMHEVQLYKIAHGATEETLLEGIT